MANYTGWMLGLDKQEPRKQPDTTFVPIPFGLPTPPQDDDDDDDTYDDTHDDE